MRLLLELLLLASDLSGLPVPDALPQVRLAPAHEMPCECMAAYEVDVLWVREDVDLDQPFGRSVVVHELTHHLQVHELGRPHDGATRWARELDAVEVQNRYLARSGSARRAAFTHRTDD